MVDFSFIVSLYVSDLPNVTIVGELSNAWMRANHRFGCVYND